MKKIIVFMCVFLCMFNITLAVEEINQNVDINSSGDELIGDEYTLITPETYIFKTLKGEVIDAGEVYALEDEKCQNLKVYIDDKGYKATALITYKMSFYEDTINYAKPFKEGDKVYGYTTFENGRIIGTEIAYRDNTKYLIQIIILFILVVIMIGKTKGIKSLISLIFTMALIFYALVPGIMSGKNPLLLTILVSTITIIVSFIIISGINKKSVSAIIGTAGGILVSGLFAIIYGNLMKLTGMNEEAGLLAGISDIAKTFDYRGIFFSGIIIGALRSVHGCWNVNCISTL